MNLQNVEKQWEFMHNNQNALIKLSRLTRQSWERFAKKCFGIFLANTLCIFSENYI